jgi:4-hydroxybenzoate polyprenyltransferase/phosphoserine phosphatase
VDRRPLYVDLDGTLIRTDLLHESLLGLVKRNPLALLLVPLWLRGGRARLKRAVAERVELDVARLPYSEGFLAYLREEAAAGRRLVLATAADGKYAEQVAAHLGIFCSTLASDGTDNLSGVRKARAIEANADGQPFEYAGNSRRDLPVWARAAGAVLVNPDRGVERALRGRAPVTRRFVDRQSRLWNYVAALRVHQWVKNALLLVPLLASHRVSEPGALWRVVVAIVAFSLTASAVYILNDLLDLGADRRHPRKRLRPFAAGHLPATHGLVALTLLSGLGLGLAWALSPGFWVVLVAYLAMTLAYSLRLKRYVLIDVLVLSALFTARVIAGGVVIAAFPSFWLLAFCVFLFTSLALVKRCSELVTMEKQGVDAVPGRDYRVADSLPLLAMGVASGYLAVLVVALYINSSAVAALYSRPEALWFLCPVLLYWVSRLWLKTARGEMHDDPLVFAVKDRASQLVGLASAAILAIAI